MNRKELVGLATAGLLTILPVAVSAHDLGAGAAASVTLDPAAREPARVVDAFHAALARGDIIRALDHLSENAVIFESGGAERSKAEYASHHAAADAAFAKAVPSRTVRRAGRVVGNTAWILTEGRTTGTYKGRQVDRLTTETMVLVKPGRWRIAHIHWSSAAAPTETPPKEK